MKYLLNQVEIDSEVGSMTLGIPPGNAVPLRAGDYLQIEPWPRYIAQTDGVYLLETEEFSHFTAVADVVKTGMTFQPGKYIKLEDHDREIAEWKRALTVIIEQNIRYYKVIDKLKDVEFTLKIVRDWKHFWMNQTQNSKEDHANYFSRAFGVDSNMTHHLADKIVAEVKAIEKEINEK